MRILLGVSLLVLVGVVGCDHHCAQPQAPVVISPAAPLPQQQPQLQPIIVNPPQARPHIHVDPYHHHHDHHFPHHHHHDGHHRHRN